MWYDIIIDNIYRKRYVIMYSILRLIGSLKFNRPLFFARDSMRVDDLSFAGRATKS